MIARDIAGFNQYELGLCTGSGDGGLTNAYQNLQNQGDDTTRPISGAISESPASAIRDETAGGVTLMP